MISARFFIHLFTVATLLAGPVCRAQNAAWKTPFEQSKRLQTATYAECIAYYQKLDAAFPEISIREYGPTDSGKPLHLFILSEKENVKPEEPETRGRPVLLIQNGIHPGEPEGIDASMMLARDLVQDKKLKTLLKTCTVLIIPIYNVDGSLVRNSHSRANQNGPESYGFRGNTRNLDLNRDYMKQDSRNAQAFAQLFQEWQPDLFVDTHTSNGADYQYTMTLIATQKDKLHPELSGYLQSSLLPSLYQNMAKRKWEMTPYVDFLKETPESGLVGFLETPRYASGFTTLFNTIGFITETHMLKPFPQRVEAQYAFLQAILELAQRDHKLILDARRKARAQTLQQNAFSINYKLDTTKVEKLTFKGFEAGHKPSEVSGLPRLYYDRKKPFTKTISYYNTYQPSLTIQAPAAYLIPQAWKEVIEKLQHNGVNLKRITADVTVPAERYYITGYETGKQPYEGHYLHHSVKVRTTTDQVKALAGDYVIELNQPANRFIVDALEPQSVDSYFNWNFFDAVLQQKEWFSDYVFEDIAAQLLKEKPELKRELEQKKASDPAFAKDAWGQLYWVYQHSEYYEPSYNRYPVARLNSLLGLELK